MKFHTLLIIFGLGLFGCAKPNAQIPSTDALTKSTYATMTGPTTAYCYVAFFKVSAPTVVYWLESDSIVACDGVNTAPNGNGYEAYFNHVGPDPVKLTIVRPQAGATVIDYVNLQ